MIKQPITEEQIQAWIDGSFEGDRAEFEALINADPAASALLAQHRLLQEALAEEEISFQFGGLHEKVLTRLQRQKQKRETSGIDLVFLLLVITALAGIGLASYFIFTQISLPVDHLLIAPSLVLFFLFLWTSDRIELTRRRKMMEAYLTED